MKPRYERPVITQHLMGAANKFGSMPAIRPMAAFESVPIADLVEQFGSPLFLFSERVLRERVRELRSELARRFADFTVAWSYKTNYLGAVCRVFHQEGAWAEVVSGMEMRKALRAGVPGSQVLFNGPGKSAADLELAFSNEVRVHLDHLDELALAEHVADSLGLHPEVGMRVSLSDVPVPAWDRFGLNLESGRAMEAARRLVRGGRLVLRALHCHLGTFIQEPDAYRQAAAALGRFAISLERDLGVRIDSLDFGGGFASRNTLHAQYLPGEEVTPSLGQYVERVAAGLDEAYAAAPPPRVILETGRALVDDAAVVVATVVGNKRLIDGRRAVVLDAGVNILPTAWWYRHDVRPAQPVHGTPEATVFYGPLCMNIDVVRDRIMFPPLRVGDRVVIGHVGAYNVTQWMQFITERPNVVMVGPGGQRAVIRKAEGLESLLAHEEVPAWLGP
jgi:diaminopimelate decarboxylase